MAGLSWLGDERIAVGSLPDPALVRAAEREGVTHVVNCRAPLQTLLSQDLYATRRAFGDAKVARAPMWDHGRAQEARRWAPAAVWAREALDDDPESRVLIHCQQGRRRSAMVAYAVLRLGGLAPEAAAETILAHRAPAVLVPAYRRSVEEWLRSRSDSVDG